MSQQPSTTPSGSPFALDDDAAYVPWRAAKLDAPLPATPIPIEDLNNLREAERHALLCACATHNFALFRAGKVPQALEPALRRFGQRLGLSEIDRNLCAEDSGITAITVKETATEHVYIPYTNRPLGWHTDGYYNATQHQVRAWMLFCAQPADEGGSNELLDHEIAFIRLRDANPAWVAALMATDALTIPGNVEGGVQIRPHHSGPVFSVSPLDGKLHMRYSARQRNVIWKDDPATRDAAAYLLELLDSDDDHRLRHRLQAGEGIVSNNVLHRRDAFRDAAESGAKRLIYRARYHQRLPEPQACD